LSAGEDPRRPGAWCRFDCAHYVRIATHGYELFQIPGEPTSDGLWYGNTAWFPGYPLLVRAARALVPRPRAAAVVVSGTFALLSLGVVWAALARPRRAGAVGDLALSRSLPALALAACFPGVIYAHAIFPLGLYCFATVLSLRWAAAGRALAAGVAGAAAAFTYPPGLLLAPALGVGFLLSRRDRVATRLRRAAAAALLTAGGFAAVLAVQYHDTGSWRGFALVQSGYRYGAGNPATTLAGRIAPLFQEPFEGPDEVRGGQTLLVAVLVASATAGAVLAARAAAFGELECLVALYTAAAWLLPLVIGEVEGGLHRREAALLPLVLLTARLPPAVQAILATAAVVVAYAMGVLFFRGALV
jgi:hypothetical protein